MRQSRNANIVNSNKKNKVYQSMKDNIKSKVNPKGNSKAVNEKSKKESNINQKSL